MPETKNSSTETPKMIQWGWSAKFAGSQAFVEQAECVKIALAYEARTVKGQQQPLNGICPRIPGNPKIKYMLSDERIYDDVKKIWALKRWSGII